MEVLSLEARLCVLFSLAAFLFLRVWRYVGRSRRQRMEHEQLLQDVALLMLEKAELEEDTTHLIVENYQMTENMSSIRERNLTDVSEENNQLFHDVALLTLENCQIHDTNQRLEEENRNLMQTIAQLRKRRSPEGHSDGLQLRNRVSVLEEENKRLKYKYETLRVTPHVYHQGQGRDHQCIIS